MHIPEFISSRLAPTGPKESKLRRFARRFFCTLEGHPNSSWDYVGVDILVCEWCGHCEIKKNPGI